MLAVTTRAFGAGTAEGLVAALREVRIPDVVLLDPPASASAWRPVLAAGGARVAALALEAGLPGADDAARLGSVLEPKVALASALRARHLVVASPRAAVLEKEREARRERFVEQLARALHGPLVAGAPLAVVNGGSPTDLLHLTETGWLLDALPRLGLWLDPARALRLDALTPGAGPLAWADLLAGRVTGVLVHGLGSDGAGHAHPEDRGPPWGRLGETLPQRVPWALDLSQRHDASDVRDAARFLEAALASPGAGT
jgi:hypothetical protein